MRFSWISIKSLLTTHFLSKLSVLPLLFAASSVSIPLCFVLFTPKPFVIIPFGFEKLFKVGFAVKIPMQGSVVPKSTERKEQKMLQLATKNGTLNKPNRQFTNAEYHVYSRGGGGGVLPYNSYTGMCRPTGLYF